ncbi:MAG: right-handed parallel beta-helix repeat-containing protein [Thermoplasmatota archaeon]
MATALCAASIFAMVLPAVQGGSTPVSPLKITSNSTLQQDASAYGWSGSGTSSNPYVASNLAITAGSMIGLDIEQTTLHVVFQNLTVENGEVDGVYLDDVTNVTFVGGSVQNVQGDGIDIVSSSNNSFRNMVIHSSGSASLLFSQSHGNLATGNTLSIAPHIVELDNSVANTFWSNTISISQGEYGFFFDAASYGNTIPTNNTVNREPVQWYTNEAGTKSAPIQVSNIQVQGTGIDNIAQVMVYDCQNLTLATPTAKNGAADGIDVLGSSNVSLTSATIEGNANNGLQVENAADVSLAQSTETDNGEASVNALSVARLSLHSDTLTSAVGDGIDGNSLSFLTVVSTSVTGSGGDGAHLMEASHAIIRDSTFSKNLGRGVSMEDAPNATLTSNTAGNDTDAGIRLSSAAGSILQTNTLTGDGIGMELDDSSFVAVKSNVFSADGTGIQMTSDTSADIDNNTLSNVTTGIGLQSDSQLVAQSNLVTFRPGGTGFSFSDLDSVENVIATTNMVNGVHMQWYVHLHAARAAHPIVLTPTVRLAGITNWAQVFLFDCWNVTLARPDAENGTSNGIDIVASNGVILSGARLVANQGDGISVDSSANVSILSSTVERSGWDGIALAGTGPFNVTQSTLVGPSGRRGIVLSESKGATVANVTVSGSGASYADLELYAGTLRAENNTFGPSNGTGIQLDSTALTAVLQFNKIWHHGTGIEDGSQGSVRVRGNTIRDAWLGLGLSKASAIVTNNSFANDSTALDLSQTQNGWFDSNVVRFAHAGATGFAFDDSRSYNNAIRPSNTVNGTPLAWYVGLRGNATHPVLLSGLQERLAGITNVAQIMLYDVSYVQVQNFDASNGSARGVFVLDSDNVDLNHGTLTNERAEAVDLSSDSATVSLRNLTMPNDTVTTFDGQQQCSYYLYYNGCTTVHNTPGVVAIRGTQRVRVENSTIRNSDSNGIQIDPSSSMVSSFGDTVVNVSSGIDASSMTGLVVQHSTFARNGKAASISQATNVTIQGGTFSADAAGIALQDVAPASVNGSSFASEGDYGIQLESTPAWLGRDVFSNESQEVSFSQTTGAHLAGDGFSIGVGQYALYFDGSQSYDNNISPTDTVNGEPIEWLTHLRGTVAHPVTVSNLALNIKGATNIAQFLLYDSSNVTLSSIVAEGGAADGILVADSTGVLVNQARVASNAQVGISVSGSSSAQVQDADIENNTAAGISVDHGVAISIKNLKAYNNTRNCDECEGVQVSSTSGLSLSASKIGPDPSGIGVSIGDGSSGVLVQSTRIFASIGGLVIDGASYPTVNASSFIDDGAFGLSLKNSALPQVTGNTMSNESRAIDLQNSQSGVFLQNTILTGPTQYGIYFEDETSYDNTIDITNTVNGHPLQWYTGLAGTPTSPVVLSGLRATVPGMTNVGQIVLYHASFARVTNALATNATNAAILVYQSASVTIANSTAQGGTVGIGFTHTKDSAAVGDMVNGSTAGVYVEDSSNNTIARIEAISLGAGVQVAQDGSARNRIFAIDDAGVSRPVADPSIQWNTRPPNGNNLVCDAGGPAVGFVGRNVTFANAIVVSRNAIPTERVESQRWSFGDGSPANITSGANLTIPVHRYIRAGSYTANLTVTLANGASYWSIAQVSIYSPPILANASNITVPTNNGSGAVVQYTAPAWHDTTDGAGLSTCLPLSGSLFPLGRTNVVCVYTNKGGLEGFSNFTILVLGSAPVLSPESNVTVKAATKSRTVVTFQPPTWTDSRDGTGAAACNPASGSTFAIGATRVVCSQTDHAGWTGYSNFTVFVLGSAPVLTTVSDIHVVAMGASGVSVSYQAPTWADLQDGTGAASCTPVSGSTFAIGATIVHCSYTDRAGLTGFSNFTVRVAVAPPVLDPQQDLTVTASSGDTSAVEFEAPRWRDVVDGSGTATCTPPAGSAALAFVGTHEVVCSYRDTLGAIGFSNFTLTFELQHPPPPPPPGGTTQPPATRPGSTETVPGVSAAMLLGVMGLAAMLVPRRR